MGRVEQNGWRDDSTILKLSPIYNNLYNFCVGFKR